MKNHKNQFQFWNSSLDPTISLAQELNLSADGEALSAKAESGFLSGVPSARLEGAAPEECLAAAIVLQAVEDWRNASAILRRQPDHPKAARLKKDAEDFLRSRWFRTLMDLDGAELLERLRKESGVDSDREGFAIPRPARLDPRNEARNQRRRMQRKLNGIRNAQGTAEYTRERN